MIFFAGPAWAGASHDFFSQGRPEPGRVMIFFAGPAWGRASHDFFSQGRPGPGRVMIFFSQGLPGPKVGWNGIDL